MSKYRRRETDTDKASREKGFSDFLNVENRRREPFPEEFPDGPYGTPPLGEVDPAKPSASRNSWRPLRKTE